jgi:hypothetical protein
VTRIKNHIGARPDLRWALVILLALAWAGWARAEDASPAASPTASTPDTGLPRMVLVESLGVEGTSREAVRRVVLSESRLVAGGSYSEQEIARAARRIKRLPFILDARPALRRGSAPGQYLLVFVVEEHSVLSLGVLGEHWSDGTASLSTASASPSVERFLGSLTALRLSVDTSAGRARSFDDSGATTVDDTPLQAVVALGLTRYDVVGPASRLDFAARAGRERCTVADAFSQPGACYGGVGWGLGMSLLVPSEHDNSLTVSLRLQSGHDTYPVDPPTPEDAFLYREPYVPEYEERWLVGRLDVVWAHDTTDDPVAPMEGTRIVVNGSISATRWRYKDYPYVWGPIFDDAVFGTVTARFERLLPLRHGFAVSGVVAPLGAVGDATDGYGEASLGLRWVHAGQRNRYRLSFESGVIGSAGGATDARHWTPYSSLRFRSGLVVIAFDVRWAR